MCNHPLFALYFVVWKILLSLSLTLSLSLSPLSLFLSLSLSLTLSLSLSLSPSLYLSFYLSFSLSPSLSLLSIILFGVSNGRFRPCFIIFKINSLTYSIRTFRFCETGSIQVICSSKQQHYLYIDSKTQL